MKKIFTLILSLALLEAFGQTSPAIAMQVLSSAGGYQTTSTFSISWTLGEPVTGTITGTSNILTQGFQQGNLLGTNIVPTDPEGASMNLKMYPNPAFSKVYFKVDNKEAKGDFLVEVFDITGRKIINEVLGEFNSQETLDLSVVLLKPGIYLVKVKIGNFQSDVIKLVKE